MAFPILRSNHLREKRVQLLSVRRNQTESLNDRETRASSSLCQLSDNIFFEEGKDESRIGFNNKLLSKDGDSRLSPWVSKSAHQTKIDRKQNSKPSLKCSDQFLLRRPQIKRCLTENNQNTYLLSKNENAHNQGKLLKISSIFEKQIEVKRQNKKSNPKLEEKQLQCVILMCKRKKQSIDTNASHNLLEKNVIQTQSHTNKSFISRILNTNRANQPIQKIKTKKIITKTTEGKIEELAKFKNSTKLINDHWNVKTMNYQNKYNKRIGNTKGAFKKETHDVVEKLYQQKRFSLDEKLKKEKYKHTNPLAHLLYEKYLHTIGVKS